MSDVQAIEPKRLTFVMMGPDLGLTEAQTEALKDKFRNELVSTLGGVDAMSRGEIVMTIIVQTECLT